MRAARLLQILLILQNRGRQRAGQLAEELEVSSRTILRDVDAMTEAGLPIIVHQGHQGGIELGFNYRTRLTGLNRDEARALGVILTADTPLLGAMGLEQAAKQARAKLVESFPDRTRAQIHEVQAQFRAEPDDTAPDPRLQAMARAIENRQIVRLRYADKTEQILHPVALHFKGGIWQVQDDASGAWIALQDWGRINISALTFGPTQEA